MTHLSGSSWQDVTEALQRTGFHFDRQKGSHMVYVHDGANRTIVVPRHPSLKPGTISAILREAGLSRADVGR
mgnify:CR=1 FL=1